MLTVQLGVPAAEAFARLRAHAYSQDRRLADVASIGLLHERNVRHRETVAEQLQGALNSRVVIEQAKGKLAERLSIDMDRAFAMLRDYARNTNQHLTDVARDFVNGATADFPRRPGASRAPSSRANRRRREAETPPVSPRR
jgi:ANTAR domain